jgi:putative flippase GtrA
VLRRFPLCLVGGRDIAAGEVSACQQDVHDPVTLRENSTFILGCFPPDCRINMLQRLQHSPWIARIARHIPPGQFGRYLIVGGFNTLFGYSCFALLTLLMTPHLPYAYILAGVLSSIINITVSFLNYKWFIFKTKGNYLREWMRCIVIYSGGILVGAFLLPACVFLLRHVTSIHDSAPYVAAAVLMAINVVVSFIGHKKFSFASGPDAPPAIVFQEKK